MSNAARPKVIKVSLTYDTGKSKTFKYSKNHEDDFPVAIFWDDNAVIKILGSYYENERKDQLMYYDELKGRFGKARADAICKEGSYVYLSKEVIKSLWETTDDTGKDNGWLIVMTKLPKCDIGGGTGGGG